MPCMPLNALRATEISGFLPITFSLISYNAELEFIRHPRNKTLADHGPHREPNHCSAMGPCA